MLQRLAAGPVSGDVLAREAGLTRAAVWKRIDALREAGIGIDAAPGRGYALQQPLDLLDVDAIRAGLPGSLQGGLADLEVAWSLDSTNSELLRRDTPTKGCAVLLAERQTGGRGRRGRAWSSPLAAVVSLKAGCAACAEKAADASAAASRQRANGMAWFRMNKHPLSHAATGGDPVFRHISPQPIAA